jgi:hypothetical protein
VLSISNLRMVILNCPYDTWDQAETRDLFGKMASLKLRGYGSEYSYGVLPLDTTDFVGCHFMLCEDRRGQLQPIMACRMTTLERCRVHRLTFPALALAAMADTAQHVETVQAIVERCERRGSGIAYDGSLTIDPRIRRERRIVRDVFTAMFVLVHDAYGVQETIAGAVLRLKTGKYLSSFGYRALDRDGVPLAPVAVQPLLGEPVLLMHLAEFASDARAMADQYLRLWDRRLTIEAPTQAARTIGEGVRSQ